MAAVVLVVARGGDEPERDREGAATPSPTAAATPRAEPTPTPGTRVVEGEGELAIGITEPNPAFVHPDAPVPPEFAPWREALQRMSPDFYRLVIDWPAVARGFSATHPGCMRDIGPCAPFAGLTAQLQALAAAQKAGGWETMVVFTGVPDRFARPPGGCERAGTEPRSRTLTDRGLLAYRDLVARVQRAADRAGAVLRYWSPWNEPNHPYFLSPQRPECDAGAPSAAVAPYAQMAAAMRAELREGQELVLGELAGLLEDRASYTDVAEFIAGLPRDLVCSTRVFGQHGYVGGADPVGAASRALRRFGCPRTHDIWITETGSGRARLDEERTGPGRRACRAIRRRLLRWYEDPRTTAAFQYTLREDDRFPTGLVTVDLERAYAALDEWIAWGARAGAADAPPRSRC